MRHFSRATLAVSSGIDTKTLFADMDLVEDFTAEGFVAGFHVGEVEVVEEI